MAPSKWISRNLRRDEHTSRPEEVPAEPHGTSTTTVIVAIVVILAVVGLAGAIAVWHRRRTKGGHGGQRALDGGSGSGPSLDGAKAGFARLWYNITNPRARSKTAGFEGISAGRAGAGTRGGAARGLDPDEAWDTRVGNEADFGYYENGTELQGTTGYDNTAYRSRGPAENPFADEHTASGAGVGAGGLRAQNPFADENADGSSMRSVSPRPVVDTRSAAAAGHVHSGDSPSKKSAFKENI